MSNPFAEGLQAEAHQPGIQLQDLFQQRNNNEVKGTTADHHVVHFGRRSKFDDDDLSESRNLTSSSENDDGEDVHFSKSKHTSSQQHPTPNTDSQDNISELPPLTNLTVTRADVLFNGVTCLLSVLGIVLEVMLVFWHYWTGHKWGSGFTALWVGAGGVVLLGRVWSVGQDKLERLYGKRAKCVRIWMNSFPWLATIITSYLTTSKCNSSRTNVMHTHDFIQLQEWSGVLLRVQSFAEAAPQAVLQLLLLLEDVGGGSEEDAPTIGVWKATTMTLCIITCLANMMTANLPSKSDVALNDQIPPSKAAYSPYSRLFIGLRMISSFASRTMSLSIFLSSFRCTSPLHTNSLVISHLIPLSILLLPRILFSFIDYVQSKFKKNSSQPEASFISTLVTYTASIFFPFGEPSWIFWYISVETILFIGIGSGLIFWGNCVPVWIGVTYLLLFVLLFGIVPVALPYLVRCGRRRRIRG